MKKMINLALLILGTLGVQNSIAADNQANMDNQNLAQAQTQVQTKSQPQTQNQAQTVVKPVSVSSVLQHFQKAGYVVTEVTYNKDDNTYKVMAYNGAGQKLDMTIDAKKGMLPPAKQKALNMVQAAKKVEQAGYSIQSISADDTNYKITALDKQNNQVDLQVDMIKGDITKS